MNAKERPAPQNGEFCYRRNRSATKKAFLAETEPKPFFCNLRSSSDAANQTGKSFLVVFFKKEPLACLSFP
jgi:hypothetical protein